MSTVRHVASCLDCPLYFDGDLAPSSCGHPKAPRKIVTSLRQLPQQCPLRVADFVLRKADGS